MKGTSSPQEILGLLGSMSEEQFAQLPPGQRRALILEAEYFAKQRQKNPLPFFVPNGAQEKFITAVGQSYGTPKTIFINASANGVGKTVVAINIVGNLIFGPQNEWFNHKLFTSQWLWPKRIWYHSNAEALSGKVSPTIEEIFPRGRYEFIKGGRKFKSHLEANGWTLDMKTYDQETTAFEAVDVGIHVFDEPPPQEIRNACVARLRSGGIEIFVMTSLEGAAWIYDEIVEKPDQQHRVFYMEADVEQACKVHGVRGHLDHERIEFLASQYDEEEREARLTGKPKHLKGKIFRTLHPEYHKIVKHPSDFIQCKPNDIFNNGYVIYCGLDPHDSRPPSIVWWAAGYDGLNYIIDEFPNNYDPEIEGNDPTPFHMITSTTLTYERIAEIIKYKEQKNGWKDSKAIRRVMDPNFGLKKSGESGKTVQQIIAEAGLRIGWSTFFDASVNDDLTNGHSAIRVLLAEDPALGAPRLRIAEHCSDTWFQLLRYSRRKGTARRVSVDGPPDAPAKKYKDRVDPVRYIAMYYHKPTKAKAGSEFTPDPNPYESDRPRDPLGEKDWRLRHAGRSIIRR